MKRTRLDRRTKVAGVIAAALLLSCCLLAGCGQEKTETTTDALDTMENQAGDVSISLGMDQTAVEKSLSTATQLDATEDPQMETISYGEGTDYLVVIYQEGKVISLGTYWEDLEDLTANTQDQDSKWQTTEGIARGAALEDLQKAYPDGKPGQEFISRGWQPAVSESFPDKGNDRRPDLCVDRRGSREDNQPDHAGLFCE